MLNRQGPVRSDGKLDRQTLLLLGINGLFVAANALSGTYIGVYLWKASNNLVVLGWFTLLTHLSMALTFWIAGNWVKERSKMVILRLGIGVSAIFYTLVLLLGAKAIHFVWLLGIVQGLAAGLFWLAFNVLYFEVTDADNRDRFNGWSGVSGSLVGMVAPWCSGYVISRSAGESGYRIIFIISFGIYLAAVGVSFFLHSRRTKGDYDWRLPARVFDGPSSAWKPVFGALAAQGLRESVFGVLIGILVYIQTRSELQLGNFALITSAIGFASFYASGKWLKPVWRRRGMLIGAAAITAATVPLFFGPGFMWLLIFGIGAALFFPLYMIPMTSSVFDMIGADENTVRMRVEYVVLRELALNTGRIVGMAIFIVTVYFSKAPATLNYLLLIIGSSPLLSWLLMRNRLVPQKR